MVGAEDPLAFDAARFEWRSLSVDGQTIRFRACEDIVYVARPVDPAYQRMSIYIPAALCEGGPAGAWTVDTAPIFLPNAVGGYMPGAPAKPGVGRDGRPNAIAVALARGLVVAAPGARGRTLKDADGRFTGKAPACIVDLKAAVRYLRHNDAAMPGSAERIISNGTSAGGALSALLGATGNSPDYEPYLAEIGAAQARDDVFAASCYCPITNLDHADAAYEWLFCGINTYKGRGGEATMTPTQIEVSSRLKALFPTYLNSLELRAPDGTPLRLDADGAGSFRDYVASFVVASAQRALDSGTDLSGLAFLTIEEGKVVGLDLDAFMVFATRMKTAPAFDALDLRSPENNLFGTATIDNQHFTAFAQENSADHTLADADIVRLMNPMGCIGSPAATTARHWRIRHGAVDRDTSLAIPVILATRLQNTGCDVDFAFPWARGHAGDYDLDELFAWIDRVCGAPH